MEKSERELITKHLSDLVIFTRCNEPLLIFMQEKNVFSFSDLDAINAIREETGKADKFFHIIQTHTNSFSFLLDGLRKTNQNEIFLLLTTGRLPGTTSQAIQQRTEQLFGKSTEPILFNVRTSDALFSGRSKELHCLHQKILEGNSCADKMCAVVISGLGGIGKSQLCRKYVEVHKKYFMENVIWIDGETETSITQSFSRLATEELKISGKDVDGKDMDTQAVVNEVYRRLQKRRCLLIFDNVEHGEHLQKYLRVKRVYTENSVRPTLLMTSRETEWDIGLEVIKLSELSEEDALEMVRKGLGSINCPDCDITELVNRLQFFPLAIRQAVAYICQQRVSMPQYSIQMFMQDFETRRTEMMSFQNSAVCTQLTNDYSWTTFTTWRVTMLKLQQSAPRALSLLWRGTSKDELIGKAAVQILNSMAYLVPNGIKFETIQSCTGQYEESVLREALRILPKFSMISANEGQSLFSIHRLVQEVARVNLSVQKRDGKVVSEVLTALQRNLNVDNLDHAMACWKHSNTAIHRNFQNLPASIIDKLAQYQRHLDGYKFGTETLDDLQKLQPVSKLPFRWHIKWDQVTTNAKLRTAVCLRKAGRAGQAFVEFYELHQELFQMSGWQNNELVYEVHLEIGECLREMDKSEEAIEALEEAMEGFRMLNAERLVSVEVALALCHGELDTEASNKLCEEMLWKCHNALMQYGKDESLLIRTANLFGLHLLKQNKISQAREILTANREREEKFIGVDHSGLNVSLQYLGRAQRREGKYEEALAIHQDIYEVRREMSGENEMNTLIAREDVALDLYDLKRYDESLKHTQQIHDAYVRILGLSENDLKVLQCKERMADTLLQLNQPKEAHTFFKCIQSEYGKKFGARDIT